MIPAYSGNNPFRICSSISGVFEIKEQILKGLLPEYAGIIQMARIREHESISELIRDIEDAMDVQRNWLRRGSPAVERRGSRFAGGVTCYYCRKEGHRQTACPEKFGGTGQERRATEAYSGAGFYGRSQGRPPRDGAGRESDDARQAGRQLVAREPAETRSSTRALT